MGWNDGVGDALDEAVTFQPLQGLREHLFADAVYFSAQVAEAVRTVDQGDQQQDAPAAGDVLEHFAGGTFFGEQVAAPHQFRKTGRRSGVVMHFELTFRCVLTKS